MEILKTPEKIKFQMEDIEGKAHDFTVIDLTRSKMKELQKMIKKPKAESGNIEEDNSYDTLVIQLAFYTGKQEKEFDNFHVATLKNAIDFINKEAQRPFQATPEKS